MKKIEDIKCYIVLRDKNNTLVDWRGFDDYAECVETMTKLYKTFNEVSDGAFHYEPKRGLCFTDGRDWIGVEMKTADLLMEILFDNSRDKEEIFDNFFREKR